MALTYDGTNVITFNDGTQVGSASQMGIRNRIINGHMMIDQRYNGASTTTGGSGGYVMDRWQINTSTSGKYSVQQMNSANTSASNYEASSAPTGFTNSLKVTANGATTLGSTDYALIGHNIEGLNIHDLGWGTANAVPATLSFWVKASITGTYSVNLQSGASTYSNWLGTYTINSANTWQYVTLLIPGATVGSFPRDNNLGLGIRFTLGVGSSQTSAPSNWATSGVALGASGQVNVLGTNGATWYITGVQLEKGSVATPFDFRLYGKELLMCQRYYWRTNGFSTGINLPIVGFVNSSTDALLSVPFPVQMRIAPTALEQSGTAADYAVRYSGNSAGNCSAVPQFNAATSVGGIIVLTVGSGLTAGQGIMARAGSSTGGNAYFGWSAEL
jgi:hypothetical protein